ncbi:MAG: hypothetical protein LUQ25_06950 [Methanoregulaceae archaeon]|nr:hypothetical protein [Methanoregulaceae archaeon]
MRHDHGTKTFQPTLCFVGILAVLLIILGTGNVSADIPVNTTPETKGIMSVSSVTAQGTVTASDSLSWQQSSDAVDAPPLLAAGYPAVGGRFHGEWFGAEPGDIVLVPPDIIADGIAANSAGEVQYSAGYSENTMAVQGATGYAKTTTVDTAGEIADRNNIAADKIVSFIAVNEQGRMTSSEDILVDGAGASAMAAGTILCPFGTTSGIPFIPPFCNVVVTGSSVDVSLASVSTSASERFVAVTADVPVVQAYSISVKGVSSAEGSADAIGSASAFMTAHLQDGRMLNITPPDGTTGDTLIFRPVRSEDITYAQSVSARGVIKAFSQAYAWQSGIRRV